MEIVKHGNMYRIVICPKCECEFRFGIKEILTYKQTDDTFGHYIEYDYIDCPECGHRIIFEERDIEV